MEFSSLLPENTLRGTFEVIIVFYSSA
jgi:hypothetical protein